MSRSKTRSKKSKVHVSMVLQEVVLQKIFMIRGKKVMIDNDLAKLYGVNTGQLTRQVRRNIERFPDDFMFQLSRKEYTNLRCQFGTSRWGGRRYSPYAFTEQGVAMLSSVLNSKRAIQVNIQIMRVFTKLREMIQTHRDIQRKINEMEKKYDQRFQIVFEAIKRLLDPSIDKKRVITGFQPRKK